MVLDSNEACLAYVSLSSRGVNTIVKGISSFEKGRLILQVDSPFCAHTLVINGMSGNGDPGIIIGTDYIHFPVQGRTVVDVGANIGDSLILFAACGARQVIGFEPVYSNWKTACENVDSNGMADRIRVERKCVGASSSTVSVPESGGATFSNLGASEEGLPTPVTTLEEIALSNDFTDGVLKIDSEGGEYDIVLAASTSTLRRFQHIVMEYHYGSRGLREHLEKAGFSTSILPRLVPRWSLLLGTFHGYLYATRLGA